MNVRRTLIPLLLILGMLMAACGSSSTGGTPITGTTGSTPAPAATTSSQGTPAAPAATTSPQGQGQQPANGQLAGGQPVEMRMAWWGSQNRHDRTIKVIELFQKQHPNVKITYEFAPFDDYFTKLTTQAAGNNLPCLIQQDYQKISEYTSRDLLMPLDDFVANGTIDASHIEKAYLDGGRLNGKLYAISLGTNTQSLLLNTAMFEKAGVALPGNDWTWAQFEQLLPQLKEKLGIYGMGTALDDNQIFKLWIKQHGKTLYNQEGTALGYDDDKLYIEFFTMIKRLMDQGVMPNREFEVSLGTVGIEDNIFVLQQAAIGYMHSNQIVAVAAANGGQPLEARIFPKPEGGIHGNYLKPSMFFSITAGCEHPDVAAALIDFFTNSKEANAILAAERGVPISSEVREAIAPQMEAPQRTAFDLISVVEKDPSPLDPPDPPGSVQVINDVYVPLMDEVLYGRMTPEEAAVQFREQANAILAQNKK